MKKVTILYYTTLFAMALSMSTFSGCSDKENVLDTEEFNKKLEAFNFKTSAPVTLSVDLGPSAAKQIVAIYPTEVDAISANMHTDMLYSAFTDAEGMLKTNVELPTAINKVWIVSLTKPDLDVMTAEVRNGLLTLTSAQSAQARRASAASPTLYNIDSYVSIHEEGNMPDQDVAQGYETMSQVSRSDMGSFWCIDKWMPTKLYDTSGNISDYHFGATGNTNGLKSNNKTIADYAKDLYDKQQAYVTENSSKIKQLDASDINQIIDGKGFESTKIELADGSFTTEYDGAELWVTFIKEGATYQNTFGYYIYKNGVNMTEANGYKMDRIVIWPSTSMKSQSPYTSNSLCSQDSKGNWLINKNNAPLSSGDRVQLLFRDPETGAVSKRFPKGYTVGFWFCADSYNPGWHTTASSNTGLSEEYTSSMIFTQNSARSNPWRPGKAKPNSYFGNSNPEITNKSLITKTTPTRFMQYDTKLLGEKFTLYAVEDGTDAKWNDILFAVSRKDYEKVTYAGKNLAVEPFHTISTYAFEDKWPDGGDFDMNDVIIEHDLQQIYTESNHNFIVRDEFRLVSKLEAASNHNAFYVQLPRGEEGNVANMTVTINGVKQPNRYEAATNSIIIFTDQREAIQKGETTVVVTRDLSGTSYEVGKLTYNPYLISNCISSTGESQIGEGRIEIHLPGFAITDLGKKLPENESINYYYASKFVSQGSKYPFAIGFVNVADWEAPNPGVRIDETFKYYSDWCNTSGDEHPDWYYNKSGYDNRK